ncbi:hypothetical protein HQ45_05575 [Porphyromonas crevioricanis]|uniref:Uncharacterized protein n=2 Tax=Porphyromonas crevioricanis TaxID=393921 RepID=A0AB34PGS5_9PORP|nr:hypothetical protein HQ45_05575 [Porphyromonas crevioricanis]KGN96358.1 hypothetical protein HQ38_01840 [Porphyromonas crevioricanis]
MLWREGGCAACLFVDVAPCLPLVKDIQRNEPMKKSYSFADESPLTILLKSESERCSARHLATLSTLRHLARIL